MSRIIFEDQRPVLQVDAGRADVACFVGLLRRVGSSIPPVAQAWLRQQGWSQGRYARDLTQLADVPIPVENYAGFTAMFDGGNSSGTFGTDYLAAAVRSFFAQGGKRCYIVRMDDPVTADDNAGTKLTKLQSLLVDQSHSAADPTTWHGVGHLAGLTDVSFLAVPDLPVLSASSATLAAGQNPVTQGGPEQFVECSIVDAAPPSIPVSVPLAPRLSPGDYANWAASVAGILQYLAGARNGQEPHLREIQFVAAVPLPQDLDAAAAAEAPSSATLAQDIHELILGYLPETTDTSSIAITSKNLSTAFLQLTYPWLKTSGSQFLLESLEPPDGVLTGILARNALKRGAFTSATKITPAEIYDLWPALPAQETQVSATPLTWGANPALPKPLIERISLFGFTAAGLRLLSDVTAYPDENYRSAPVNRLVSVICRAARRMGEHSIFEQSGPDLWGRVQRFLQQLLTRLWTLNALDGATVQDAFSVRCDQSTMTQNDLDNGRMVAVVTFTAAATLELIRVTLALQTGGASSQEISAALAEVG
jgi:hypothetical protein